MVTGDADGFGSWLRVYAGPWNVTYFDDRHLPIFTTYQYRLTVHNDFHFTFSPTSAPVATFGGAPSLAPNVTADALNHTSIHVNWTLPREFSIVTFVYKCS